MERIGRKSTRHRRQRVGTSDALELPLASDWSWPGPLLRRAPSKLTFTQTGCGTKVRSLASWRTHATGHDPPVANGGFAAAHFLQPRQSHNPNRLFALGCCPRPHLPSCAAGCARAHRRRSRRQQEGTRSVRVLLRRNRGSLKPHPRVVAEERWPVGPRREHPQRRLRMREAFNSGRDAVQRGGLKAAERDRGVPYQQQATVVNVVAPVLVSNA